MQTASFTSCCLVTQSTVGHAEYSDTENCAVLGYTGPFYYQDRKKGFKKNKSSMLYLDFLHEKSRLSKVVT